jgi:hypothetical protein
VLVLWSKASIASSWVRNEAAEAQDRGKLIPVLIESVKVPIAFRHMQTCDLTSWDGVAEHTEWDAVVQRVAQLHGGQVVGSDPVSREPLGRQSDVTKAVDPRGVKRTLLTTGLKPRLGLGSTSRFKPLSKRAKIIVGAVVGSLVLGGMLVEIMRPDDEPFDPSTYSPYSAAEVITSGAETTSNPEVTSSSSDSTTTLPLDRNATSGTYGQKTLAPGFLPDPEVVQLRAGGNVDVSALSLGSGCVGWAANNPDFVLTLNGAGTRLRVSATSSVDTVLAVLDPSGTWRCNDDSGGNSNPMLTFEPSIAGTYRVWVPAYRQGNPAATLQFSERATP